MAHHEESSTAATSAGPRRRAGLFDIRMIIGALLGLYGVIVLLTGLFSTDHSVQSSKTINIWVGIALLVVAAVFAVWTRLRPIVVPEHVEHDDQPPAH